MNIAGIDKIVHHPSLVRLYDAMGIVHLSASVPETAPVTDDTWQLIEDAVIQDEIGSPGTPIFGGVIGMEQNARMSPLVARGASGQPGVLEHLYRTEPHVFSPANSLASLVRGATYELRRTGEDTVDTIAQAAHRHHMRILPGLLKSLVTFIRMGFAVCELQWGRRGGSWYLHDAHYREPATVQHWILDDRQQRICGAVFGSQNDRYYLPMSGGTPSAERMAIVNINATGLNVEGVTPARVCAGLRSLKELILNVSGGAIQKWGLPLVQAIADIQQMSAADAAAGGGGENAQELQLLIDRLDAVQSQVAAVLNVPQGYRLEAVSFAGTMPDFQPLLTYLDAQMSVAWGDEASTLGSASFGSYALAATADARFMRLAPTYAQEIADMLTRLLHLQIRWNHPDSWEIEEWPSYTHKFSGTQDASRWISDMSTLSAHLGWPDEARRQAAGMLGLSTDAFIDGQNEADE